MLNILFFSALATYLIASIIQFVGAAFKKEGIKDIAWWLSILGFAWNRSKTSTNVKSV
jgi:hypothetical protein